MGSYLFTSESVTSGHPDKVADQISDAIVDYCIEKDRYSRVACETLVGPGLVILSGEITSSAPLVLQEVVRNKIREIGYDSSELGFDYRSVGILTTIHKQSQDIARGIRKKKESFEEIGAGDQGIMFGYACQETENLMPLPLMLAHALTDALKTAREKGTLPFLRPDGKSQVTVEYHSDHTPKRIHTVVLSAQHHEDISEEEVQAALKQLILETLPAELLDEKTLYHLNPTGRFVLGGPAADTGVTGRKTAIDTYGGRAHHGGGAFSGKDPTKMDRAGAYAARHVAKNIVAAGLATTCEVQLSYAIGTKEPISIHLDTFNTSILPEEEIEKAIPLHFNLTPGGIIKELDLDRPIYSSTAYGGHFGRPLPEFTWEHLDKVDELRKLLT